MGGGGRSVIKRGRKNKKGFWMQGKMEKKRGIERAGRESRYTEGKQRGMGRARRDLRYIEGKHRGVKRARRNSRGKEGFGKQKGRRRIIVLKIEVFHRYLVTISSYEHPWGLFFHANTPQVTGDQNTNFSYGTPRGDR